MDKLVFTALSTLSAQRFERQSITNELANLSTVGFKKSYETALETLKRALLKPGVESSS